MHQETPPATAREFMRTYLSHFCRLPFSRMHEELFARHETSTDQPVTSREGTRFALAAPRGHAKSTVMSLALPLFDICHQRERYIVLFSATAKQAIQRLRSLRNEISGNRPLIEAFPGLAERAQWSSSSFCANGVQVDGFGAGAEVRGISFGAVRPTRIILDDVEDSRHISSAIYREDLLAWYDEVVEHLGDTYTNIDIVGTVLHPSSLLTTLLQRPGYTGRLYRSVEAFATDQQVWNDWETLLRDTSSSDPLETARAFFDSHREQMLEGARVLWPEKEDYYRLMLARCTRGKAAFFKEKQNEPLDDGQRLLNTALWRWFALRGDRLVVEPASGALPTEVRLNDLRYFGFLDSACAKDRSIERGDYSAIATIGVSRDGIIYVVDLWMERGKPSEQIRRVFDLFQVWPYAQFGFEANCFQSLLGDVFKDESAVRRNKGERWQLAVKPIVHTDGKLGRISRLEGGITTGWTLFSRGLPVDFLKQADDFPRGRHDDGLDALEAAISLASTSRGGNIVTIGRRTAGSSQIGL